MLDKPCRPTYFTQFLKSPKWVIGYSDITTYVFDIVLYVTIVITLALACALMFQLPVTIYFLAG